MIKPLRKITRYGNHFDIIQFEKPLIIGGRGGSKFHRKRSENTFKQSQNIHRSRRNIKQFIGVCTAMYNSPPAIATFTYKRSQKDMQEAIQNWRDFTRVMKKQFPDVAFLRVPERHKSGSVHFHAVLFGLPEELPCHMRKVPKLKKYIHACKKNRLCERNVRRLAGYWKKGFVDLQVSRHPDRVGSYISKYLTKNDPDWTLFGSHVCSCNRRMYEVLSAAKNKGIYYQMTSFNSPTAVDFIIDELRPTLIPRKIHSFNTLWLGVAKFENYDIIKTVDNSNPT